MINLIRFLARNFFFVYFLILEVVCFYVLFQFNDFHRSKYLNASSSVVGGVYSRYDAVTSYINLKEKNEELNQEINLLRNQKIGSFRQTISGRYLINDSTFDQRYIYIPSTVINNSINKRNNYLTLHSGSLNGIEQGMGVVHPQGVVGIVDQVSENYSTVISVLHKHAKISVKIKKNNYFGSLIWDGKDYREGQIQYIPNHVAVSKGDTIVTSGYSAIFPANIQVGIVNSVEEDKNENFLKIRMRFLMDFKNLVHVGVVKNLGKDEQLELEELNREDD